MKFVCYIYLSIDRIFCKCVCFFFVINPLYIYIFRFFSSFIGINWQQQPAVGFRICLKWVGESAIDKQEEKKNRFILIDRYVLMPFNFEYFIVTAWYSDQLISKKTMKIKRALIISFENYILIPILPLKDFRENNDRWTRVFLLLPFHFRRIVKVKQISSGGRVGT